MARVYGRITDLKGAGVEGVRVQVIDEDSSDSDDLMGQQISDANGEYDITHSGGWDSIFYGPPEIYITVSRRAAGGEWTVIATSGISETAADVVNIDLQVDRGRRALLRGALVALSAVVDALVSGVYSACDVRESLRRVSRHMARTGWQLYPADARTTLRKARSALRAGKVGTVIADLDSLTKAIQV